MRTTYGYDGVGRQTSQLDACGNRTTLVYNCRGDLVQQIDAQNRITTNNYDPLARLTAQRDASGAITTSIFDPAGRLLARQNPRGYFTSYSYDSLNRQTGVQDPTGVWTTAIYDSRSNRIADIDGLGYRTTALYDNLSRQIGRQNALGYWTTTVYDSRSNPIATMDPLGHRHTTLYDVLQRPQAQQRPDGAFVTTVYDANSNPIASVSPLGFITTQAYDTRNRLIGRQDPLGRWHTVTYDNAGRLWMQQDGKGQITTHTYLNCGDEYTRLYADNTRLTFSYNSLRQLTGVADPTGLHTFSYDVLGRLVSFVGPAHPNGQPITYGYDANSNRTLLQGWEGRQTYTYDPRDLLTVVQDPGAPAYGVASGTTTFSYDPRHLWLQQTNSNGTHSTVTYDPLQRFSQIRHSTAANAEIAHSFYTYDAAGRLTLLQTEAATFTYGYDVLDQLTGELSSYPAPTPYSSATSYSYDANLRRIGVHSNGVLTTATYDAADQLRVLQTTTTFSLPYNFSYADPLLWSQVNPWTTFSYDANGSPVTVMSGLFLTTYSWDAANRLKSVSLPEGGLYTQTYRFDDLRQRRQGPANIDTFIYAVVDPATQRDGLIGLGSALSSASATGSAAATGSSATPSRWSSEAAPLLWWQRSGAASEWLVQSGNPTGLIRSVGQSATGGALNRQYHLDALGTAAATSTGTGTTETTLTYDAWGNRLYPTPGPFPGTPVGNVAFTAAATGFGEALSLTFSNRGYIALPPSVWTPTTAFSVSCRIQSTYSGSNPAMILGVSSPVAPQQFWLGLVNGVVYVFGYNLSTWVVGTTAVDDGNWHTVLATYSGGVWSLYVDGVSNGTGSGTYVSEPSVHVAIGALPIAGTYEFTGLIDELAIFNTVISTTVPTVPWANNTAGLVALYHLDGNLEDSAQSATSDNRLGFVGGSGYWQEPELGLAYVRARWLSESTGSWLSVDPVSSEPRYSYAHNMPTTRVDPSGRQVPMLDTEGGFGGGIGTPVTARRTSNDDAMRILNSLNFVLNIMAQSNGDYDRFVDDLLNIGRKRWKAMTFDASVGFMVVLGLPRDESIWGMINPAQIAFDGARASIQDFVATNSATWRAASSHVPAAYQGYAPPVPGTGEFVQWLGGFLFGIADVLRGQVPFNFVLGSPVLSEQIQQGLWQIIVLLRRSKNLFGDLYDCAHLYLQYQIRNFKEWIKNPVGDYFDNGEKTSNVLLNVLQLLVQLLSVAKSAVKAIAVIIAHLNGGGRLVDLLAKYLGHPGVFMDGENPRAPRPGSGAEHREDIHRERAPFYQQSAQERRNRRNAELNDPETWLSKEEYDRQFGQMKVTAIPIHYGKGLSKYAIEFRNDVYNGKYTDKGLFPKDASKAMNVAIFEYRNPHTGNYYYIPTWSRGVHAETIFVSEILPQLEAQGIMRENITQIYSELAPCDKSPDFCSRLLQKTFPHAQVTYSFEYPKGVSDLREAVKLQLFGGGTR